MSIVYDPYDPERAADILEDFRALCKKHRCAIFPGNAGEFVLAKLDRIFTDTEAAVAATAGLSVPCKAIAVVRQINPGFVEWANVQETPKLS
jgi:hypothetical protein